MTFRGILSGGILNTAEKKADGLYDEQLQNLIGILRPLGQQTAKGYIDLLYSMGFEIDFTTKTEAHFDLDGGTVTLLPLDKWIITFPDKHRFSGQGLKQLTSTLSPPTRPH
jgi:hypothetical protein